MAEEGEYPLKALLSAVTEIQPLDPENPSSVESDDGEGFPSSFRALNPIGRRTNFPPPFIDFRWRTNVFRRRPTPTLRVRGMFYF